MIIDTDVLRSRIERLEQTEITRIEANVSDVDMSPAHVSRSKRRAVNRAELLNHFEHLAHMVSCDLLNAGFFSIAGSSNPQD